MKPKYKVFPDYGATGIWDIETGESVSFDSIGLSDIEQIAIKYWVDIWKYDEDDIANWSEYFYTSWYSDGQKIVDCLNKKYGDIFVYDVT